MGDLSPEGLLNLLFLTANMKGDSVCNTYVSNMNTNCKYSTTCDRYTMKTIECRHDVYLDLMSNLLFIMRGNHTEFQAAISNVRQWVKNLDWAVGRHDEQIPYLSNQINALTTSLDGVAQQVNSQESSLEEMKSDDAAADDEAALIAQLSSDLNILKVSIDATKDDLEQQGVELQDLETKLSDQQMIIKMIQSDIETQVVFDKDTWNFVTSVQSDVSNLTTRVKRLEENEMFTKTLMQGMAYKIQDLDEARENECDCEALAQGLEDVSNSLSAQAQETEARFAEIEPDIIDHESRIAALETSSTSGPTITEHKALEQLVQNFEARLEILNDQASASSEQIQRLEDALTTLRQDTEINIATLETEIANLKTQIENQKESPSSSEETPGPSEEVTPQPPEEETPAPPAEQMPQLSADEEAKTEVGKTCPVDFTLIGPRCFRFNLEQKDHMDHKHQCNEWGGYLAILETEEIYNAVKNFMLQIPEYQNNPFALEGYAEFETNRWMWNIDSPITGPWSEGEPKENGSGLCLELYTEEYLLQSNSCVTPKYGICQNEST